MGWPITRDDLIKALNFPVGATDQADLDLYARAAVERVEEEVGPITGQTFISTVRGPADTILIDHAFVSVTSVTVDAVVVVPDWIDTAAGIIKGTFGEGDIVITTLAPAIAPAVVEIATRELAAIWFKQAHSGRPGKQDGAASFVPLGFAIPREISEKLAPYVTNKLPGIA